MRACLMSVCVSLCVCLCVCPCMCVPECPGALYVRACARAQQHSGPTISPPPRSFAWDAVWYELAIPNPHTHTHAQPPLTIFPPLLSPHSPPAAQVYRARIRATGQEVAVKVQRPQALGTISKVRGGVCVCVCVCVCGGWGGV